MLRPEYPLLTERLLLRPFRDDDLDAFHAIQSRPDIVRYLYWEPKTRDEAKEMLDRRKLQVALEKQGDGLHLAAEHRGTGELVGHFSLFYSSEEHQPGRGRLRGPP